MKQIDLSIENVQKTKFVYKKLKDFKPKYVYLEIIFQDIHTGGMYFSKGIVKYHEAIKKLGDYTVLSVHNYEDTRTTSVILETILNWWENE